MGGWMDDYEKNVGVASIKEQIMETHLRLFGYEFMWEEDQYVF